MYFMALHRPHRQHINQLRAKIGEIEPNSRPIVARGGKDGLTSPDRSPQAESRAEKKPTHTNPSVPTPLRHVPRQEGDINVTLADQSGTIEPHSHLDDPPSGRICIDATCSCHDDHRNPRRTARGTNVVGVRPARASAYLRISFARPLFDWQNAPRQFFEAMHSALSPTIAVSVADFSVRNSNSLNEVAARYELFGGPNAVVLSAGNLSLEFSDLVLDDYGLAARIAESVDQRLHADFPECGRAGMRLTLNEHLDVLGPGRAEDYLSRYAIPTVGSAFARSAGLHQHGALFSTTDVDKHWRAHCSVERSEVLDNALFLTRDVMLLNVDESVAPRSRLALMWEVIDTCARALDLEVSHE